MVLKCGESEKLRIDKVVLNVGVLEYPNGVMAATSETYQHHFQTNTFGPLLAAKHLLSRPEFDISTMAFISSDSGSAGKFLSREDGFATYAASKAALNMGLRHLAAALHRERGLAVPIILAIHPGEVNTDMAKIELPWEVQGEIEAEESVRRCLKVIEEKGKGGIDEGGRSISTISGGTVEDGATYWTWDGRGYPW